MSYEQWDYDPTDISAVPPDGIEIEHLRLQDIGVHIIDAAKLLRKAQEETVLLVDSRFKPGSPVVTMRAAANNRLPQTLVYQGMITLAEGNAAASSLMDQPMYDVSWEPLGGIRNAYVLADEQGGFDTAVVFNEKDNAVHVSNELKMQDPDRRSRLAGLVAPGRDYVRDERAQLVHYVNSLIIAAHVACDIYESGYGTIGVEDLVLTPDGPLVRDPATGRYIHRPTTAARNRRLTRPGQPETSLAHGLMRSYRSWIEGRAQGEPQSSDSETLTVPDISFHDLFAIDHIQGALQPIINYYKYPEVMRRWQVERPPVGILLQGPAGTGKTSIIKAFAHAMGAKLKEVSSADIYSPYAGVSEANLKKIFDSVRNVSEPTVLFFDEIDGVVSESNNGRGGGSLIWRSVAGVFKTQVQSIAESNPHVIFAAATNKPEAIDEALIRSGRFDLKLTVGLPNEEARRQMWGALLANLTSLQPVVAEGDGTEAINQLADPAGESIFAPDVDYPGAMKQLALASEGYTAADFKTVLSRVKLERATAEIEGRPAGPITVRDLLQALHSMRRAAP